jgi:hypothetical protein
MEYPVFILRTNGAVYPVAVIVDAARLAAKP